MQLETQQQSENTMLMLRSCEGISSNMTCFHRLTDEARKLISDLGSKNVKSLAFRDNWLFVGGKGVTVKGDFEKVTATTSWTP